MTPTKKDGEKRGLSAISEVVTGEYTVNSYKCTHGVRFKERALQALKKKKNLEMCHEGDGTPDVHTDVRLNKAI